jgi:branched-chain amino acid transport system ATP-binding protein
MSLLNFEWLGAKRRSPGAVPLLAVESVSVRLGQRLVLDDVSLEVFEGEQVRITGPNGAGKSTLLNAIMGVVPTTTGRILFKGEDLGKLATHERANLGIRYMRQRDNVFPTLTASENLNLALGEGGYNRFREQFPAWAQDIRPETPAGMLSGGQKQKLAWGMSVLNDVSLLLSDEASAGSSENLAISSQQSACFVEHN